MTPVPPVYQPSRVEASSKVVRSVVEKEVSPSQAKAEHMHEKEN